VEYIRRDAEGGDSDTRRRAAAELVKSLTEKFPSQVTQLCTGYVTVSTATGHSAVPLQAASVQN
jgi:exportin-2 (importin alpha re-exporter)